MERRRVIDPAPPKVWIENKKSLRSLRLSGKKPRIIDLFFTAEAQSTRRLAPTIPARSANPSLLEAEVRMGEGRSEGAKAGPYRDFVNVKVNESGLPAAKFQLSESGAS